MMGMENSDDGYWLTGVEEIRLDTLLVCFRI